ncbi:MAG: phosphatidylserine decarboxylase [Verrucomicrobiales bacterium]|nr:phosphatidylserine decarboxylase [Verrucomicrobiales bacterium]MEC7883174.1 archaetidylserine decarboxylase [Verrucomicrobiota bacterium]|tara:strand:+ start:179 stop:1099 length:921 start_codon:yes stop_codon:yes gene_type:complete
MTVEQNLANGEVRYIDRHTGELKTEDIYGERVLRWVYGNPLGRMAQWLLIRRWIVSAWYGSKMDEVKSSLRIVPFINKYGLDESEFADPVGEYLSFNEFFYRKLKLKSRPIDTEDNSLVFPADGRHMAFANISSENNFIVKGQIFNLKQFLGDDELAERYKDGSMLLSRLCPVDYHRFHFPCSGKVGIPRLINGWLYSVNPIALVTRPTIFWENKRIVTSVESVELGQVQFVEVGATMVGSVRQTYIPGEHVAKGDEKGYFAFGGSSVVVLFEKGRMRFDPDLLENTTNGYETYARFGERMGQILR